MPFTFSAILRKTNGILSTLNLPAKERRKLNNNARKPLAQRNLFRRITIASDERLRTAAERIAMLDIEEIGESDTLWNNQELLTSLEIRQAP